MPPKNALPLLNGLSINGLPTNSPGTETDDPMEGVDAGAEDPVQAAGDGPGAAADPQANVLPMRVDIADRPFANSDQQLAPAVLVQVATGMEIDAAVEGVDKGAILGPLDVRASELAVGSINPHDAPMSDALSYLRNESVRNEWQRSIQTAVFKAPSTHQKYAISNAQVQQRVIDTCNALLDHVATRETDGTSTTRAVSTGHVGGQQIELLNSIAGVPTTADAFGHANDVTTEMLKLVTRAQANESIANSITQAERVAASVLIPASEIPFGAKDDWLTSIDMRLISGATRQIQALIGTIQEKKDGSGYVLKGGAVVYGDPDKGFVQQLQDEIDESNRRLLSVARDCKRMEMAVHHTKQNLIFDHVRAAEVWVAKSLIEKQQEALREKPSLVLQASGFFGVADAARDWSILSTSTSVDARNFYTAMIENYQVVSKRHRELQALVASQGGDFVLEDLPPLVTAYDSVPFEKRHEDWLEWVDQTFWGQESNRAPLKWKDNALELAQAEWNRLAKEIAQRNENIAYLEELTTRALRIWTNAKTDHTQLTNRVSKDSTRFMLGRWGSAEQFRRCALEQWVRRSAYIHSADTTEAELSYEEVGTGFSATTIGWKRVDGRTRWIGRRMRDPRGLDRLERPVRIAEVAGEPNRGQFAGHGRPLRVPRLTCAYESLLWYFGGDDNLELMTTIDQFRTATIRVIGCKLASKDPVLLEQRKKANPEYGAGTGELKPEEFETFTPMVQELVEMAGMRYFCARLDTLALCTADKLEVRETEDGQQVAQFDVYQAEVVRQNLGKEGGDPNYYRSDEWKSAHQLLDMFAKHYCMRACIAGGHDQVYRGPDQKQLYTIGKLNQPSGHKPDLNDLPFGMPGTAFDIQTTAEETYLPPDASARLTKAKETLMTPKLQEGNDRFLEPFRWEDTILLSKVFGLVEQMAMDVEPHTSRPRHDGEQLRHAKVETYFEVSKSDYIASQAARTERYKHKRAPTAVGAATSRAAFMLSPHEWQEKAKRWDHEKVPTNETDARLLNRDEADEATIRSVGDAPRSIQDVDTHGWSVAMEIEANPHAAALWTVYLHRLLTLRVLNASGDKDQWYNDPTTGEKVRLKPEDYFTYGLMSQLFAFTDEAYKADPTLKGVKGVVDAGVPNTCDAWIYTHPSVEQFRRGPLGKYMERVFETAKHSWGVRESRILELTIVWGGRKLNSTADKVLTKIVGMGAGHGDGGHKDYMGDNSETLEVCRKYSALRKVLLDETAKFTAADLYVKFYTNRKRSRLQKLWYDVRRTVLWLDPATIKFWSDALQLAEFTLPGFGLIKHGLAAYNALNPAAQSILHTAFGAMAFRRLMPETTKATVVAGSSALVNAGVMAGKLFAEAHRTTMTFAAVLPLVLRQALTRTDVLKPTDVFIATLDDMASGMLDGKGIFDVFETWKLETVKRINKHFNEYGVARFNDASLMSLQGFMWGMMTFGWVDDKKKPYNIRIYGIQAWANRYKSEEYWTYLEHMEREPDLHGPVIWDVYEDTGQMSNLLFSLVDEPSFRHALLSSHPSVSRVARLLRAVVQNTGIGVELAGNVLKRGIDLAADLGEGLAEQYSAADPLTWDLVKTNWETRRDSATVYARRKADEALQAGDSAFRDASLYINMMYHCSGVGIDARSGAKRWVLGGWTGMWDRVVGKEEDPREDADCQLFLQHRDEWWAKVRGETDAEMSIADTAGGNGGASNEAPRGGKRKGRKSQPADQPAAKTLRTTGVFKPGDAVNVEDTVEPPSSHTLRAHPSDPMDPTDPQPPPVSSAAAMEKNFQNMVEKAAENGTMWLTMISILGLGGRGWIVRHGSAALQKLYAFYEATKFTNVVTAVPTVLNVNKNTPDAVAGLANRATLDGLNANLNNVDLQQLHKLKTALTKLVRPSVTRRGPMQMSG